MHYKTEYLRSISLAQAQQLLKNEIYEASALIEQLEHVGKIYGNGHHLRQKLAEYAAGDLGSRWLDGKLTRRPTKCDGCKNELEPEIVIDIPVGDKHFCSQECMEKHTNPEEAAKWRRTR